MDINFIIGVVGIIATIVFGILSFDLFKRKKYPGKITYVKLSLIDLLNNVANNFNEIKLLHNNSPIKKNLIYIKGALLNNGDVDINGKLIEKDISVHLPEKCKWLDVKATKFSEGLSVNIKTEKNEIAIFKFDLFRRNEYLQFEGLIEAMDEKISSETIENKLLFKHRIENTNKIETKNLLSDEGIKQKKKKAIISSIGILLFMILISLTLIFNVFGTKKEEVYFSNINKSNEIYSIKLSDSIIELSPILFKEKKVKIPLKEFNENYIATSKKLSLWQKFKERYWFFAMYLGVFILIVATDLIEIKKANSLSKILKK